MLDGLSSYKAGSFLGLEMARILAAKSRGAVAMRSSAGRAARGPPSWAVGGCSLVGGGGSLTCTGAGSGARRPALRRHVPAAKQRQRYVSARYACMHQRSQGWQAQVAGPRPGAQRNAPSLSLFWRPMPPRPAPPPRNDGQQDMAGRAHQASSSTFQRLGFSGKGCLLRRVQPARAGEGQGEAGSLRAATP